MFKKCNVCNKEKDTEDFPKDKAKKDGHRKICKQCDNLRRRKTPIKPIPKEGYKYCACCNEELPLEDFNIRVGKPYSYCKSCEHEKDNNRYEHKCSSCGKEYLSGKKDIGICKECYREIFGNIGKENLKILNANQSGSLNVMFDTHRFGTDNPNYNPNKTDEEREQGRLLEGYTPWRISVYSRDNYTCQCCGDNKGGNLVAHHLNGYNWAKDERTDVNNGITLCKKCHKKFHDLYNYRDNTKQQFEEFNKKLNEGA